MQMDYIKDSFKKFKQDTLSKLFYDLFKYTATLFFTIVLAKTIPTNYILSIFLSKEYSLSIYKLMLYTLIVIFLTISIISILFIRKYKKLKLDNFTDELTGLKNHKALKEYLLSLIINTKNENKTLSIILIDIDNFKTFNTQYGYKTADILLVKLGDLLSNDKRITDETFRQFLRGDEFIIVAKDTNLDNAVKAAERKRLLIQNTAFLLNGTPHNITISCGVTVLKNDSDTLGSLLERVNNALLLAKSESNKNNTKSIL